MAERAEFDLDGLIVNMRRESAALSDAVRPGWETAFLTGAVAALRLAGCGTEADALSAEAGRIGREARLDEAGRVLAER